MTIRTFRHKGLKNFFDSGNKAGIQAAHAKRIKLILDLLNGSSELNVIYGKKKKADSSWRNS